MRIFKVIIIIATGIFMFASSSAFAACNPPTCTKIIDNGPDAGKKVLVVLGDGYAAADQNKWINDVKEKILDGVFAHDFYLENHNAFNVYRLNLVSNDSGVSQKVYDENGTPDDKTDDTVVSLNMKDTALKFIFSGVWSHCWLEGSPQTNALVQAALAASVPNYDNYAVILNEDRGGGCAWGGNQHSTRKSGWTTMAHEFGHGIGGLKDEYSKPGNYTGAATNNRNCSTVANRDNVFWSRFIDPSTPVPTNFNGAVMDSNFTVGTFPGCQYKTTGIYRPVHNCRMKGNSPEFCPVCYTLSKAALFPALNHDFEKAITGDFDGDGRDDVVIHNDRDLSLYLKSGAKHELNWRWTANNVVPGTPTWQPREKDRYYVADFSGDGKQDLIVFNGENWNKPYLALLRSNGQGFDVVKRYDRVIPGFWTMRSKDQLYVSDFNGDGKDDLLIRNGKQWSMPYLGMLKSNGTSLAGTRRYAGKINPGAAQSQWRMRREDRLFVGDFDGDNKDDIYIYNSKNWNSKWLGMLKSSGVGLSAIKKFGGTLPNWALTHGDKFLVADFNGDNKDDLYVHNTNNWKWAYLLMVRSTGNSLAFVQRYNSSKKHASPNVPGWSIQKGDKLRVADPNNDGKEDLFVYNTKNWSTEWLGTLISSGNSLQGGSKMGDRVGGWNLGKSDMFLVADYQNSAGDSNIYIRNKNWFGFLRNNNIVPGGKGGWVMDRIYQKWIYSALHDKMPWSTTLP